MILATAISASGYARGETPPLAVTEIAPGIFVHNGVQQDASPANDGEIANIGFVIGNNAVAVIDPGGSDHEGIMLRARDPRPDWAADPLCDHDPCPSRPYLRRRRIP